MAELRSFLGALGGAERHLEFNMGDIIFNAGEPGGEMYVVTSGTVAMRARGELLETVDTGGIFGEMALVDQEPRSATAVAVTACELVPIDEKRFQELLRREPGFGLQVMRVMAERLRRRTRGVQPARLG